MNTQNQAKQCCTGTCKQGRDCPLRQQRELDRTLSKTPESYLQSKGLKL